MGKTSMKMKRKIFPCPSEAVLSGTGGVFKSPEAQAYFARRFGGSGALNAARLAGRVATGRVLDATNEIEAPRSNPVVSPIIPSFFSAGKPIVFRFREPIFRQ